MAKYNSRRSGVRAGSKPALAPEPQDCHGALVGLPPHERNGMGHGGPQDMVTMGEGTQQIPSTNYSQKNRKMLARCLRERGGDETAGWLHFRESLAEKRKGKRQRQRQRQRGGEAAKERCQQVKLFFFTHVHERAPAACRREERGKTVRALRSITREPGLQTWASLFA